MENKQWYEQRPWLQGLIWGWSLFLIMTGIDYWNGELPAAKIPSHFASWTIGGLIFGYARMYLLKYLDKKSA